MDIQSCSSITKQYLHKTMHILQVLPNEFDHSMSQCDIGVHLLTAQIEISVSKDINRNPL